MNIDARRIADDITGVLVEIDRSGIQISAAGRQVLREAADELGWLSRQADWRAAVGDILRGGEVSSHELTAGAFGSPHNDGRLDDPTWVDS